MCIHYSFNFYRNYLLLHDAVIFNEIWRPYVLITGVVAVLMVNKLASNGCTFLRGTFKAMLMLHLHF